MGTTTIEPVTQGDAELLMAVIVMDRLGYDLDEMIKTMAWQQRADWLYGAKGYHEGVEPGPGGEGWTRAQAAEWQRGWDYAWLRCPYSAEAWPDYEPQIGHDTCGLAPGHIVTVRAWWAAGLVMCEVLHCDGHSAVVRPLGDAHGRLVSYDRIPVCASAPCGQRAR